MESSARPFGRRCAPAFGQGEKPVSWEETSHGLGAHCRPEFRNQAGETPDEIAYTRPRTGRRSHPGPGPPADLVVRHVTVVDVTYRQTRSNQRVSLHNGRIATTKIHAVIAQGKLLDRADLDRRMREAEAMAKAPESAAPTAK
jgi:hypothetical protein